MRVEAREDGLVVLLVVFVGILLTLIVSVVPLLFGVL